MKEALMNDINRLLTSSQVDKSSLDKVYASKEINEFKKLAEKEELTRGEVLGMMYMLAGVENKLVNYGAYDRYVLAKFFVWIRDIASVLECVFDYQDKLKENGVTMTLEAREYLKNNLRLLQHAFKFLVDLYLMMSRSTLSLNAVGFKESLSNRFDVNYSEKGTQQAQEIKAPKIWG